EVGSVENSGSGRAEAAAAEIGAVHERGIALAGRVVFVNEKIWVPSVAEASQDETGGLIGPVSHWRTHRRAKMSRAVVERGGEFPGVVEKLRGLHERQVGLAIAVNVLHEQAGIRRIGRALLPGSDIAVISAERTGQHSVPVIEQDRNTVIVLTSRDYVGPSIAVQILQG